MMIDSSRSMYLQVHGLSGRMHTSPPESAILRKEPSHEQTGAVLGKLCSHVEALAMNSKSEKAEDASKAFLGRPVHRV
eukprot:g58594.t1